MMLDSMTSNSNFDFLNTWDACQEIQQRAKNAESNIKQDPRVSCFYARNCLELMVETVFDIDKWLSRPRHDTTLMSLIHDRDFKQTLQHNLFGKLKLIIRVGNRAVHDKTAPGQRDALQAVKELHHVLYWFVRTYAPDLDRTQFSLPAFDESLLLDTIAVDAQLVLSTTKKLQALEKQVAEEDQEKRKAEKQLLKENDDLKKQNQSLLEKIALAKQEAEKAEDQHDYSEADTRNYLIDQLLHEADWPLDQERDREYPVTGMPLDSNPSGNGAVDYVLWDGGTPLAVVEAKRTSKSPKSGQTQAALYADCLEKQFGVRPIIYFSNGYETQLWDDFYYPSRIVQGFHTKNELLLMIKRRTERKAFFAKDTDEKGIAAQIDDDITNRHYQKTAIIHILQHFEQEHERKTLLVMATGTGKTRTIISLVDLLTKNDWIKNVLFLADRNALLTQAKKNFVKLLPRISCSILDSGLRKGNVDSRLYFSTYPTMKNLLDKEAIERPFGIGHFDLVVVDEAHRSVYRKYRQIFDYFDSLLVGLTATPKGDIDKNTYDIFDLQTGMPTYAYESESAYSEKFLVPPTKISVATKFIRQGIKYEDLSEEEQEQWEEKEELEGRDEVLPSELNTFLFNKDTADKMFAQLMTEGIKVEGGDVIGKTIIFAANNDHAEFLQAQFDINYPKWKGKLAQVVTYKNKYAQTLIDEFSEEGTAFNPEDPKLRIAISVDMLDTGIDVPEVVNLVFFKVVQSKVKFTQMIGRGTRLCEGLFGPGDDKITFKVFDYCQNFEFFNENPDGVPDSASKPVSQQVFERRLRLATLLEVTTSKEPDEALDALKSYKLDLLHHQVNGMNLDNFIVRPKRQSIEPFLQRDYWNNIQDTQYTTLEQKISNLPTEADAFNEDEHSNELANRFDNLILTMQLSLLEKGMIQEAARTRLMEFAQQLESKTSIPAVKKQLALLQIVQTQEFWQHIDLISLENVRRKLRNLMFALDKSEKEIVYTDFEDEITGVIGVTETYTNSSIELAQYRKKMELYIKDHEDQITIQKLKRNKPITQSDLDLLENLLLDASGMADVEAYREKILENKPLGTFIRELIGLDMAEAKTIFSDFLDEGVYNSEQINFVNTIINYLMSNGVLELGHIFEPPFTNLHDESAYGLFEEDKVVDLFGRIRKINSNAVVDNDADIA